jgi:putative intracellular protease/amidase
MPLLVRRTGSVLLACALALLTLAAVAVTGARSSGQASGSPPAAQDGDPARPASSSPSGRIGVAVVVGANGTVGSDVLAPYEVFARSGEFSVYTVAASAAPAPLEGGPGLVPAHTFAEVDSGLVRRPDVVVVPALSDPTGAGEAPLRDWIVRQYRGGARLLSVCNGAEVLAATGLLDGHRATSHWSTVGALRKSRPAVDWVRGQRYVRDGSITTTAGVASGVPGALAVIDELAGPAEAARIGRAVDFPGWSLHGSTGIPVQRFTVSDLGVGLDHVLPWWRPVVGVGLADGSGEIDVAAAFEVYSMSAAASTVAVAPGSTVTTRHGIVLEATPLDDAPDLDRLVVPGAATAADVDSRLRTWARERRLTAEPLSGTSGELGFDAALQDLATHAGRAAALSAAKMIDYPVRPLAVTGSGHSERTSVLLALSVLLAVGVGLLPATLRRALRRSRSRRGAPAGTGRWPGPEAAADRRATLVSRG